MTISMIVAMDRRGLIGNETGMPWHLPRDLKRFRELTWGKPIVMGRVTFEHIGRPLPGRMNVVLTRDPDWHAEGCRVGRSLREGLLIAEQYLTETGGEEVMIIGGAKVYAEALACWDRLYLTVVEGEFTGDAYFPIDEFDRRSWRAVCTPEAHPADEKNPYRHTYHVIERTREESPDGLTLAELLARSATGR